MQRLSPPRRPETAISLVSMIDVLMIMLVFFMVTSTFLHLDMLPLAADRDGATTLGDAPEGGAVLIRLGADGQARLRGQVLDAGGLEAALRARPGVAVTVLPSAQAPVQGLAMVMDAATAAGVARLDILRLDVAP